MRSNLGSRILAGAALIALATLIALLLGEGALRLTGISFPVFEIQDEARGVALKPGKEGWYRKEGEALVRINSHGYRDAERALAKPAGTLRIAVLGASFVEARQEDHRADNRRYQSTSHRPSPLTIRWNFSFDRNAAKSSSPNAELRL